MDLTAGWLYDLIAALLCAGLYGSYRLWRWLTYDRYERWHRRQVDQHLADTAVRIPIRHAHEWDWPTRHE